MSESSIRLGKVYEERVQKLYQDILAEAEADGEIDSDEQNLLDSIQDEFQSSNDNQNTPRGLEQSPISSQDDPFSSLDIGDGINNNFDYDNIVSDGSEFSPESVAQGVDQKVAELKQIKWEQIKERTRINYLLANNASIKASEKLAASVANA
ncbi:MAG: hypothetical protein HOA17_10065 [Candidatus Melainabacteria bacterium]|jgi:hypothetical protein|nr:hypothetical protein [Candidatus Melainabacteria bacterium]